SEEHTSELQSLTNLVCRLLLEKKKEEEDVAEMRVVGRTSRAIVRCRAPDSFNAGVRPKSECHGNVTLRVELHLHLSQSCPPRPPARVSPFVHAHGGVALVTHAPVRAAPKRVILVDLGAQRFLQSVARSPRGSGDSIPILL